MSYSDEDILLNLIRLYKQHGKVTTQIVNQDDDSPAARTVQVRFGGIQEAREQADIPNPNKYSEETILSHLQRLGEEYDRVTSEVVENDEHAPDTETIRRHFGRFNIAKEKAGLETFREKYSEDELQYLRENPEKAGRELAEELDRPVKSLTSKRSRAIERSEKAISTARQNDPVELDEQQEQILLGCLLGDGCITNQQSKNPRFTYTSKNENMVQHLQEVFPEDFSGAPRIEKSSICEFRSRSLPNLEDYLALYEEFEKSGRTVRQKSHIPEGEMTSTVLSYWHAGDGCALNDSATVRITSKFNTTEYENVIDQLKNFGINAKMVFNNKLQKRFLKSSSVSSRGDVTTRFGEWHNAVQNGEELAETLTSASVDKVTAKGHLEMYGDSARKFLKITSPPIEDFAYKWDMNGKAYH